MPHTFTENTIIREVMSKKFIAPHFKLVIFVPHITYYNSYNDILALIKDLQEMFFIFSKENIDMTMDVIHVLRQLSKFLKI